MLKIILKSVLQALGFVLLIAVFNLLWDGFSTASLEYLAANSRRQVFMLVFMFIVMVLQNIIIQQKKDKLKRNIGKGNSL